MPGSVPRAEERMSAPEPRIYAYGIVRLHDGDDLAAPVPVHGLHGGAYGRWHAVGWPRSSATCRHRPAPRSTMSGAIRIGSRAWSSSIIASCTASSWSAQYCRCVSERCFLATTAWQQRWQCIATRCGRRSTASTERANGASRSFVIRMFSTLT